MLSHPLGINSDRSKKHSIRRRFRPATTWLDEPVRDEVDRIAQREGLTRSKTLRNLITWAVYQKLHLQTAALIPAVIEQSFDKVVGKRLARTDNLLVRAALDISQTRTIATNTLGRQPGVTGDTLNLILDTSLKKAKDDLTHRSPEMEIFIAAVVENRQKEEREERDAR